jgi:hypothetical protein
MDSGDSSSPEENLDGQQQEPGDPSAEANNTETPGTDEGPEGETPEQKVERLAAKDTEVDLTPEQITFNETVATAVEEQVGQRLDKMPRFIKLNEKVSNSQKDNVRMAGEIAKLTEQIQSSKATRDFAGELSALGAKLDEGEINLAQYQEQTKAIAQAEVDEKYTAQQDSDRQKGERAEMQERLIADNPFIETVLTEKADEVAAMKIANPLHDDLSAALVLHIADLEEGQQAAIDEAVLAAEKKFEANVKAKVTSTSLGSAQHAATGTDESLKDTAKSGGVVNALVESLKRMRQAS